LLTRLLLTQLLCWLGAMFDRACIGRAAPIAMSMDGQACYVLVHGEAFEICATPAAPTSRRAARTTQ